MVTFSRSAEKKGLLPLFCLPIIIGIAAPFVVSVKWPPINSFWAEVLSVILVISFSVVFLNRKSLMLLSSASEFLASSLAFLFVVDLFFRDVPYKEFSVLGLLFSFVLLVYGGVLHRYVQNGLGLNKFTLVFAFGLLFAALVNVVHGHFEIFGYVLHEFSVFKTPAQNRIKGLVAQPNHAAIVIYLGVASLIWLKSQKILARAHAPILFFLACGLSLTVSRAGLLVALLAYSAYFVSIWWRGQRTKSAYIKEILLMILFFGGVLFYSKVLGDYSGAASLTVLDRTFQDGYRTAMIREALGIFMANPFGGGFSNYPAMRWELGLSPSSLINATNPHNIILQILVEWGVLGIFLLIFPVLGSLIYLSSSRKAIKIDIDWYWLSVFFGVLAFSMFEYPHNYTYFGIIIFSSYCVLCRSIDLRGDCFRVRFFPQAFAVLSFSLVLFISVDYARIQSRPLSIEQFKYYDKFDYAYPYFDLLGNYEHLTFFSYYYDYMLLNSYSKYESISLLSQSEKVFRYIMDDKTIAWYVFELQKAGRLGQATEVLDKLTPIEGLKSRVNKNLEILNRSVIKAGKP